MNCDAKQGCFFKKSVCNSGCKSKLPVEIAKVSTARLTFSSPLARLAEAVSPFLFFFLFLLRLQLFFLIKPLGVIFRSKKWCWDIQIFPWTIYFPSIAPYDSTTLRWNSGLLQIFQPMTAGLTTALRCNHNWLKYLKEVDISSYRCKIVRQFYGRKLNGLGFSVFLTIWAELANLAALTFLQFY